MAGILMKLGSFLAKVEGLVIDVAYLVLGKYFNYSENHRPNSESSEIVEYPERVLEEEVVDCLW